MSGGREAAGGSGPEERLPLAALRARLLGWFAAGARPLPWRVREGEADPYAVWVSEVMLQQTRVEVAAAYFTRWMERLPTLESLADAPEGEVLKLWEGLGYYSRARNLQRAARQAVQLHGTVPRDPDAFGRLPGVGPYTRGAVSSIAFGLREPAVDGNARRVLARWLDAPDPAERELTAIAASLVSEGPPGELNQALMELGQTLCRPRAPECGICPVEDLCGARRSGSEARVPAPRRRTPPRPEAAGAAIARRGDRLFVVRLPETGRLGGTWAVPHASPLPGESPGAAALRAAGGWFPGVRAVRSLPPVEHTFSHVRVLYHPLLVEVGGEPSAPGGDWLWADAETRAALPFSTAMRKVLRTLPPAAALSSATPR